MDRYYTLGRGERNNYAPVFLFILDISLFTRLGTRFHDFMYAHL